jgi:hypothetical protein
MTDPFANWPPIITDGRHSRLVVIRDVVLTLLMWAVLGLILFTEAQFVWESVQVLLGKSDAQVDAEIAFFLRQMRPLMILMAALVFLLALATLVSRRRRREAIDSPPPPPLPDAELAALSGMSEAELAKARHLRIAVVSRGPDGRMRVDERLPGVSPAQERA